MTTPVEPTDREVAAAARALFLVQNDDGAKWWDDFLTEDGRRVWCDDVRPILAAALPLIRERIAADIEAIDVTVDSPFGQFPFRTKAEAARIARGAL